VIVNGLVAILFMIGYVLLGVAMIRTVHCLAGAGVLVAVGAPGLFAGLRDSAAGLGHRVADCDLGS
jgi:hypothetical protein